VPEMSARVRAAAVALLVTFLWSTSWVLIRVGLDEDLPPITFAGMRYGLASLVLVAWMRARRLPLGMPRDRGELGGLIALGIVFYALTQGAQFVAIGAQPQATTSLLLAMTPLLVALSSAAFLGEHTSSTQRAGGLVIVAGSAVYFGGQLGATAVGLAASIIGLLANSTAALLGRAINRRATLSPATVTVISMPVGAALLLATGLVIEDLPAIGGQQVAIVIWLAVVNTAAAFSWWNHAQRHLTASEMAAINTTMVIQIPLLAWIFLDEPLGVHELTGIVLVAFGVTAMRASNGAARSS
jgi:drug/metabolite transporter (DMT)-like permease